MRRYCDRSCLLVFFINMTAEVVSRNLKWVFGICTSCQLTFERSRSQSGHSSGKPGKVRELKSGQGKVRENRKNQGKVRENELLQLFSCCDYCSDNNR